MNMSIPDHRLPGATPHGRRLALRRARWLAASLALVCVAATALDVQGHRGSRGLAPENTLPAFEQALDIGVTTLELDVGVTADGVVVISHDPHLNPAITRDASGQWLKDKGPLVRSLTLAQLQAWDVGRINPDTTYGKTFSTQVPRDGTRIPTLAALFALVKEREGRMSNTGMSAAGPPQGAKAPSGGSEAHAVASVGVQLVRFNIETKINPTQPDDTLAPEPFVAALLKVVRDAGVTQRVTIQSFDWRTLQIVQKAAPAIPTVYLSIQTANTDNIRDGQWTAGLRITEHGSVPKMVKAAGGAVWSPNGGAVTQALVQEAQALGLKVVPWTINLPSDMDRLIGWGVDGIITDYPDRLRDVMRQRGLPLPRALKD